MRRPRTSPADLLRAEQGASGVEFAIIAPLLILLLFGGFALTEAVALSRKVTVTTRALADLVSQYTAMSASDMATVENASTQILAPFAAAPLGIRITQITVTSQQGKAVPKVDWSTGRQIAPYPQGLTMQLPAGMPTDVGLSYILAETAYTYSPPVGLQFIGAVNLGDRIFMLPRVSQSVTYSGS